MNMLAIDKDEKILIIAPHPDDESIGTGGLLCMYPELCTVVVMTDGRRADKNVDSEKMAKQRSSELSNAMSVSKITNYVELKYPDRELNNYPDCLSNIDFSNFSMLFIPHQNEIHPDHMSVFGYAINEISRQHVTDIVVLQYETRQSFETADYYLDITDVIERKVEMINCYKSQIKLFDHAGFAKAINNYVASKTGESNRYFEAYTSYKLCGEQLNVQEQFAVQVEKYKIENELFKKWLNLKIYGNGLSSKLSNYGWDTVGLYGYGKIGRLVYDDLCKQGIHVAYALDRNADKYNQDDLRVHIPDKKYENVDVVIISCLYDVACIRELLESLGYDNVVSIMELVGSDK